jgi:hypothetical protein
MEKLIIDRGKWYRGQPEGSALLREEDGKMCCLGFDCLRRGFTPDRLIGVMVPESIATALEEDNLTRLKGLVSYCECEGGHLQATNTCEDLVRVNDDALLDELSREEQIADLFAEIGVTVEFIN